MRLSQQILTAGLLFALGALACAKGAVAQDQDTVAIEITPGAATAQLSAQQLTSTARELLNLERLSFRLPGPEYVGAKLETAGKTETPVVASMLAGAEAGGAVLPPPSAAPTNEVYEWLLPSAEPLSAALDTPFGSVGCGPSTPGARSWLVAGEVAVGTGSATYTDREYQEFELSETLSTPSGKEYEFYQRYDVDHSYVNSGTLTIGGEQRLPDFLRRGLLELNEEFRLYRDRDDRRNDRQEGLFELNWEPSWQDGRLSAEVNYRYRIREYEDFSTRSNIHHRIRATLERQFGSGLTGSAFTNFDDYSYSLGSTRGTNRVGLGGELEWELNDSLTVSAGAQREQKHYDVRKESSYDKRTLTADLEWQPDEESTLKVEGRSIDYARDFNPLENYTDERLEASYQRYLSRRVDASFSITERRKRFDTAADEDLDEHRWAVLVNAYPSERFNAYAGLERRDYAYANPLRAYERKEILAGLGYSYADLSLYLDWRSYDNSFDSTPDRDYTLNLLDLSGELKFDPHRLRVYYGIGALNQEHPGSLNDYDETHAGAEWEFALDPQTDLTISYDFSERAYELQHDIDESRFEARLSFEL